MRKCLSKYSQVLADRDHRPESHRSHRSHRYELPHSGLHNGVPEVPGNVSLNALKIDKNQLHLLFRSGASSQLSSSTRSTRRPGSTLCSTATSSTSTRTAWKPTSTRPVQEITFTCCCSTGRHAPSLDCSPTLWQVLFCFVLQGHVILKSPFSSLNSC